jgi:AmmeMemoRadiSam system protein A
MTDSSENYLSREEEQILLRVARAAIEEKLLGKSAEDMLQFDGMPSLCEKHGVFVTLHCKGELRGCIGYIANEVPLLRAVTDNAVNAATRDYRFPPVTAKELPNITIEISALTPGDSPKTPFRKIRDISEIVIGRDGLYIEHPPMHGGVLLPQVAVEQGWDVQAFLSAVCRKAGYPDDAWKLPGYKLHRFSAQVFSEDEAKSD